MADWTPQLTLNHELLDAQHAAIFRCLSTLAAALAGPRNGIEVALAALSDALVTHLATEERIMDEALYPERARHKSAHELFMADFLQMRELLHDEGATATVSDWITVRIPEWLRFHISVNDHPLGVYLARRGAQPGAPAPDGGRRPS